MPLTTEQIDAAKAELHHGCEYPGLWIDTVTFNTLYLYEAYSGGVIWRHSDGERSLIADTEIEAALTRALARAHRAECERLMGERLYTVDEIVEALRSGYDKLLVDEGLEPDSQKYRIPYCGIVAGALDHLRRKAATS